MVLREEVSEGLVVFLYAIRKCSVHFTAGRLQPGNSISTLHRDISWMGH